jgi:tripartite-type tricarboxylate transporter receptor subunit TctC
MRICKRIVGWSIFFVFVSLQATSGAETLEQLIAGAKKEPEFTFIAGAQTFGGQKKVVIVGSGVQQEIRPQR